MDGYHRNLLHLYGSRKTEPQHEPCKAPGDFWEHGIDPKVMLSDLDGKVKDILLRFSALELNHVFSKWRH